MNPSSPPTRAAPFATVSRVARSLRVLGGEATVGDLLVLTGFPSPEVEESLRHLLASGNGHVRVFEDGGLTYRIESFSSPDHLHRSRQAPSRRLITPRPRRSPAEGMLGFDYKTLRLIRARRGVLSLAELVEHTGFSLSEARREMAYLAQAYGGRSVPSLDGHLVWTFPQLMATAHETFATREPRPAWLRARAPLRAPGAGRSRAHFGLLSRVRLHLRAVWCRRRIRWWSRREVRRFALGHVYQVALAGKGVVSLDRAVAFVRARAGTQRISRGRVEAVLRDLAEEFDAPITAEGKGLFFGFRNVKRQFLASELVRREVGWVQAATGKVVFDSGDSPAAASRRELDLFDEELARSRE